MDSGSERARAGRRPTAKGGKNAKGKKGRACARRCEAYTWVFVILHWNVKYLCTLVCKRQIISLCLYQPHTSVHKSAMLQTLIRAVEGVTVASSTLALLTPPPYLMFTPYRINCSLELCQKNESKLCANNHTAARCSLYQLHSTGVVPLWNTWQCHFGTLGALGAAYSKIYV